MGTSEHNQAQAQMSTNPPLLAGGLSQSLVQGREAPACVVKEVGISLDLEFMFLIPEALAANTI